jgi:hypothetical protein
VALGLEDQAGKIVTMIKGQGLTGNIEFKQFLGLFDLSD